LSSQSTPANNTVSKRSPSLDGSCIPVKCSCVHFIELYLSLRPAKSKSVHACSRISQHFAFSYTQVDAHLNISRRTYLFVPIRFLNLHRLTHLPSVCTQLVLRKIAVLAIHCSRTKPKIKLYVQHCINQDVDPQFPTLRRCRQELVLAAPPCGYRVLLVELAKIPLQSSLISIEYNNTTILSRGEAHTKSYASYPCPFYKDDSFSLLLSGLDRIILLLTGLIALFGGGNHSWVTPRSAKAGASSSICFHHDIDSCSASHVKACSYKDTLTSVTVSRPKPTHGV
jgi:hypothetical protein